MTAPHTFEPRSPGSGYCAICGISAKDVGVHPPPATEWKVGNEFAPYHPQASHVSPDYRDGWNACYRAALASAPPREPTGAMLEAGARMSMEASVCSFPRDVARHVYKAMLDEWAKSAPPASAEPVALVSELCRLSDYLAACPLPNYKHYAMLVARAALALEKVAPPSQAASATTTDGAGPETVARAEGAPMRLPDKGSAAGSDAAAVAPAPSTLTDAPDIVERLREAAHALANLEWYADSAVCDRAADDITRLRARVAELEKDAARYRFLRDMPHLAAWWDQSGQPRGADLDAAVDAAREG